MDLIYGSLNVANETRHTRLLQTVEAAGAGCGLEPGDRESTQRERAGDDGGIFFGTTWQGQFKRTKTLRKLPR